MSDGFWERIESLSNKAIAIADQHYAAAREDLDRLMKALEIPEPERDVLRGAATQERLYHPRLVTEFVLEMRSRQGGDGGH